MTESVVMGRGMRRHLDFIRSIFVDVTESCKVTGKDELSMTLDELLGHIFDDVGD